MRGPKERCTQQEGRLLILSAAVNCEESNRLYPTSIALAEAVISAFGERPSLQNLYAREGGLLRQLRAGSIKLARVWGQPEHPSLRKLPQLRVAVNTIISQHPPYEFYQPDQIRAAVGRIISFEEQIAIERQLSMVRGVDHQYMIGGKVGAELAKDLIPREVRRLIRSLEDSEESGLWNIPWQDVARTVYGVRKFGFEELPYQSVSAFVEETRSRFGKNIAPRLIWGSAQQPEQLGRTHPGLATAIEELRKHAGMRHQIQKENRQDAVYGENEEIPSVTREPSILGSGEIGRHVTKTEEPCRELPTIQSPEIAKFFQDLEKRVRARET